MTIQNSLFLSQCVSSIPPSEAKNILMGTVILKWDDLGTSILWRVKMRAGKFLHSLSTFCLDYLLSTAEFSLFNIMMSFNYVLDQAGISPIAIWKVLFTESIRTPISRHSRSHGHLVIQPLPHLCPAVTPKKGHRQGNNGSQMFIFIFFLFLCQDS